MQLDRFNIYFRQVIGFDRQQIKITTSRFKDFSKLVVWIQKKPR